MAWERWNPAHAKSRMMRTAALEDRMSYHRKTWREEWEHRLDDPDIRQHQRQQRLTHGVVTTCVSSQELHRLLRTNLHQTVNNLRKIFQEAPHVTVSVVSHVQPVKMPPRRMVNVPLQPPLQQQLQTTPDPRTRRSFSLTCSDV